MVSRRERRQLSADMELGRRHPYLYGASGFIAVVAVAVAVGVLLVLWWMIAPEGILTTARWVGWAVTAAAACWLFWWVALRRR